jgi:hypothetical protein
MPTVFPPHPATEPSYVAWMRSRQQLSRRRQAQLAGLQAQADPSEAAGITGPITAWAQGRARDRRRQANAIAQLQRGAAGLRQPVGTVA